MARNIQDYDGQVHAPDSDYPNGDIKDDTGALDGTNANRKSNADIHQFFMKLLRLGSIDTNGLADNEYNGFQLVQALLDVAGSHRKLFVKDGVAASDIVQADYSTQVLIQRTAQNGHVVSMAIPTGTYNAPITIYNYSAFSVSVDDQAGTNTINSAAAPFSLPALTAVEFTYDSGSTDWVMNKKYALEA